MPNLSAALRKLAEKFGRFEKLLYLCIRFSWLLAGMGWKTGGNALIQNELNNSITNLKPKQTNMIIVPVKEGENIERALKKFKRKYEKTGVVKELRRRQQYNKPSVLKRLKMEHAIYVQKLRQNEEI